MQVSDANERLTALECLKLPSNIGDVHVHVVSRLRCRVNMEEVFTMGLDQKRPVTASTSLLRVGVVVHWQDYKLCCFLKMKRTKHFQKFLFVVLAVEKCANNCRVKKNNFLFVGKLVSEVLHHKVDYLVI